MNRNNKKGIKNYLNHFFLLKYDTIANSKTNVIIELTILYLAEKNHQLSGRMFGSFLFSGMAGSILSALLVGLFVW